MWQSPGNSTPIGCPVPKTFENIYTSSIIQIILKNTYVYMNAITIDFFKTQKFGGEQEEISGIV